MTTQKNRDATVFLVSQNAVITRPVKSQPQPKNIKHQQAGRFVKKTTRRKASTFRDVGDKEFPSIFVSLFISSR
jgi:hypothetical protein